MSSFFLYPRMEGGTKMRCSTFALVSLLTMAVVSQPACESDSTTDSGTDSSVSPHTTTTTSSVVCRLIGEGSQNDEIYGTDLGFTFEHQGEVVMVFGDTLFTYSPLPPLVKQDDAMSFIRLPQDPEDCLDVEFVTGPDGQPSRLEVIHNGTSLSLGILLTPVAGFSGGETFYVIFARGDFTPCQKQDFGPNTCEEGMVCREDIGQCLFSDILNPTFLLCRDSNDCITQGWPLPCMITDGLCTDPTSSQNSNPLNTVAWSQPIAAADDPLNPGVFTTRHMWKTNKFINPCTVTVNRFDEAEPGNNDYASDNPHHLLIFGRPGFSAIKPCRADVYLLYHDLDTFAGEGDAVKWEPRYFAGFNPAGQPTWSDDQKDAAPIISPEIVETVNQMSAQYLEPIGKWVMLYAGGLPDIPSVYGTPDILDHGAIQLRLADQPWGPWSDPQPLFDPELEIGYGPDGILYRADCPSEIDPRCPASDPLRQLTRRLIFGTPDDYGVMYAPFIIDAFTKSGGAGMADVYWTLSTWNPYRIFLMKTRIVP